MLFHVKILKQNIYISWVFVITNYPCNINFYDKFLIIKKLQQPQMTPKQPQTTPKQPQMTPAFIVV